MSEAYKAKGIVIRNYRLGDNDKIIHVVSKEKGPIKAVAKGAYKINSKLGPKTQVLQFCEFLFAKGRNLDIVQEIRLIDQYQNIQKDFDKLSVSYFLCEIIDAVTLEGDETSFDYLDLLLKNLDILNQQETVNETELKTVILNFLWNLTCTQGYKPELNICYKSGRKRSSNQIPQYFDFENGSIISERAYLEYLKANPYETNMHIFKPGVFKLLEELEKEDELLSQEQANIEASIKFLQKHLEFCLHRQFKSWKILEPLLSTAKSTVST